MFLHRAQQRIIASYCSLYFIPFHSYSSSTSQFNLNNKNNINNSTKQRIMEVEVKIRLPSRADYDKVASLLNNQIKEYEQENIFFEGSKKELGTVRSALRLRFFDDNDETEKEKEREKTARCVITLKEAANIVDGISRAQETEEPIDAATGRQIVDNPSLILSSTNSLLKKVVEKYNITDFICLGGFKNTRKVYDWENHKLELDETRYDFGTTWEIEIESTQPEEIKKTLQEFLSKNNIPSAQSLKSKFANFLTKKID